MTLTEMAKTAKDQGYNFLVASDGTKTPLEKVISSKKGFCWDACGGARIWKTGKKNGYTVLLGYYLLER